MDPLVILLVGGLVATVLWSWLARRSGPRDATRRRGGSAPLGLRSAREVVEERAALEAEDLAQMLELHNARRRRRGEAPRTVEEIELLVAADAHDHRRRREAETADAEPVEPAGAEPAERDLEELLRATNRRRRARGLPERTREDVRAELGVPAARRDAADRWPAV